MKDAGKKPKLTPRLRFPEFRDAPGWEEVALGEIAEIKLGKMLDSQKHTTGRLLPYLNNVSVRWNDVNTSKLPQMYFEDEELDRFGLIAGDVVVCEGGEPGRSAVWDGRLPDLKFQKAIHRVRFNVPFEPRLLVLYLESIANTTQFEMLFTGGGIKHLTRETFAQFKIPLVSHAEQHRIAACLSSLDELIEAESRKLDALKSHKKGLMQQLFPREGETIPRLRFPEFRKAMAWRKRKISEVLTKTSIPVQVEPERTYREIGIRSHGKGVFHKEPVSGAVIADKRVFQVVEDALVLNIVFAWERAVATTSKDEVGMIASHRFPMYVPKSESCDVRFMKHALLTPQGKNLLGIASPGGAGRNRTLGQDIFEDSGIIIPGQEEQARIADCIRSVDDLIASQTAKLESVKSHKRGLTQQLFPPAMEAGV
jgi:type I restriction enzyme S subunit